MFEGFSSETFDLNGVNIHARIGGDGPPLLLLHGYPQTHALWHKIAPALAETYTVICPDLRGYGDSGAPASDETHVPYSKRRMAEDQLALMSHLGHAQFRVAGHDRGGRVTRRLILDHPDRVISGAVLDIVPTLRLFDETDMKFAMGYYHWFFLAQPAPFPETMIGQDPAYYLKSKLEKWSRSQDWLTDEALSEYIRCFSKPEVIHASCEDYRAAGTIDLEHDRADATVKSKVPLLVLWGSLGQMGRDYDVLATWQEQFPDARGTSVPSGHFLPEEAPNETLVALQDFFAKH